MTSRFPQHGGPAAWSLALVCALWAPLAGQDARPVTETSLASAPALAAQLASHGRALLLGDDLVQALATFRKLRAEYPDDVEGLLGLGEAHLRLGHADLAAVYARSAGLHPDARGRATALEVQALLRARSFERALEVSSAAVAELEDPGPELLAAYASALFRLQRTSDAAAAYRRVLAEVPLHPEAHVRLGSGLIEPGDVPFLPELEACVAEMRRGDLDEAIASLLEVVHDHPDHPVAHRLLGEALLGREARASFVAHAGEFARLREALPVPEPSGDAARQFLPAFSELSSPRRTVAARALALFASLLPRLVTMGGRHDLLLELERTTEASSRASLRGKRTFDGRVWDDVRGIGGLRAATGIEALDEAYDFGFDTLAHEIAHQAHLYGFKPVDRQRVRELYRAASAEHRFLDYYAANNEAEYFGQGVEAFASFGKRPGREPTHGHTRFELYRVDRPLYDFIAELVDFDPLRDVATRRVLLPAAIELALRCGRPEDALVAAEMMDEGPERTALVQRAQRALLVSRAY
jgi:tetratricopeptide (TPR) repeat protein